MNKKLSFMFGIWAALLMCVPCAHSQTTGGVFPPTVNENHQSLQLRIAVDPDGRNDDFAYASRLHFQKALNDDFMWRVIGQVKNTADQDVELDFLQAELFWELSSNEDQSKHGFRLDVRLRDDNRPEQLGLNFMNQFNFGGNWSARVLALTSAQFGENSNDGINLQSRFRIARRFGGKETLGVELYNNYGNTGNIGSFNEQSHMIGPFFATPLSDGVSLFTGPLFGLSDAAADAEARLWITKSF